MIKMHLGMHEVIIKELNSTDYQQAIEETWTRTDHLDRNDGPARTVKDLKSGMNILTQYYQNGQLHRIDGPAEISITRDSDSLVLERHENYYSEGLSVRAKDKPSSEIYDMETDLLIGELYTNDQGENHRDEGPALWWKCGKTGIMRVERFEQNGHLHRLDGPALIMRDHITGITIDESYFFNGLKHRVDGPAFVARDEETGQIIRSEYWKNGKLYNPNDRTLDIS